MNNIDQIVESLHFVSDRCVAKKVSNHCIKIKPLEYEAFVFDKTDGKWIPTLSLLALCHEDWNKIKIDKSIIVKLVRWSIQGQSEQNALNWMKEHYNTWYDECLIFDNSDSYNKNMIPLYKIEKIYNKYIKKQTTIE